MKTLLRLIAVVCLAAAIGRGQETPPKPGDGSHRLVFYDASGNLEYVCWASTALGVTNTFLISDKTLTNIVDSSNTATVTTADDHGLTTGATVVVSGSTADTDLNGTYTITVTGTTTFTFTSASVTDNTYTTATLSVVNSGPKDTGTYWAIQKFFYDGSNRFVKSAWADGTQTRTKACASRATYTYR